MSTRLAITTVLIISYCFFLNGPVRADVRAAGIFTDNLVLQQQKKVPVWGWANAGEQVTVQFAGQEKTVRADDSGEWLLRLDELPASSSPQQMIISGTNTVVLNNILVGEVWLCSGQSNMEMGVGLVNQAEQEIAGAYFPQIRLFDVPKVFRDQPLHDVDPKTSWKACNPQTIAENGWGGFSATAYFFGRHLYQELGVPIGLIDASWGGTRIEPWTAPEGFHLVAGLDSLYEQRYETPEHGVWGQPLRPAYLYNGMIYPLVPFAIRGAIWYQGESNAGDGQQYYRKMNALVKGWREVWQEGTFPFYYAQIAPWKGYDDEALPELWEAQLAALAVPNTGMAGTLDIGDLVDIHPKNKQEVGRRLALWALAKTYQQDLVYCGPRYKSMKIVDGKIVISFDYPGGGLASRDHKPLSWFIIAGEDHKFVRAKAEISNDTVVVWNESIDKPAAVRFAWSRFAEPNLMNQAGLPAFPFRTDAPQAP